MQPLQPGAHPFRLFGSDTYPEEMHALRKSHGISESPVQVGFYVEFLVAEHERTGRATESANIREKIEMIEGGLKSLHSAHGQAGHGAMIAIRNGSEVRVNI